MSYKVVVKWNKKTFDVDLDTSQPPAVFKMQLYSLTSVAPDKQKIMIKGGVLKDDTDWSKLGLKDGFAFMMMGTAGESNVIVPTSTTKFIEDMTDDEISKATDTPAGLVNLGNTCYLNATIQCLKSIPEFSKALSSYQPSSSDASNNLTTSFKSLFHELENSGRVTPLVFVMLLRALYPQFDQQERGVHMQQDAEECWGQIVSTISQKLKDKTNQSFVDRYFGIELTSTWKCDENPDEPVNYTQERMNKLQCHITNDVNNLNQGISETLTEKIEKNSPTLNRMTVYTKSSRISYLPSYLTVNFVRFFWRKDTKKKTKILRKVAFPFEFDAYEFCTEDLKQRLIPKRQQLADYDKSKSDSKLKDSEQKEIVEYEPATGENTSGFYELTAVLTHIGRSSDSGHYMAWVKKDKDSWWKFDDDKVSLVNNDEIRKLDGGGDWHMAYICIYSEKKIPILK